jgi:hypothetical protein
VTEALNEVFADRVTPDGEILADAARRTLSRSDW